MLAWLSANLINITLIAAVALIVFLLVRVMVRDRKAGKAPCGGNCASCGACRGCASCSGCGAAEGTPIVDRTNRAAGKTAP
jgi:hypothetical protein